MQLVDVTLIVVNFRVKIFAAVASLPASTLRLTSAETARCLWCQCNSPDSMLGKLPVLL